MWIHEEDNGILYFISDNYAYKPNVAIMSFNHTLIADEIKKSKIQFMSIYNENVVPFLEQINEQGSLVVIENTYKISAETLKTSIGQFFKLIENETRKLPFIIIFATKNNKFKKPYTHVFSKLQQLYASNKLKRNIILTDEEKRNIINLDNSLVIGNNAGRLRNSMFKADMSDVDRAFAANIKIAFRTNTQVFTRESAPRQWSYSYDVKKLILSQKMLIEPNFADFITNGPQVVMIAGAPTSGKTLLSKRIASHIKTSGTEAKIYDVNNYTSYHVMLQVLKNDMNSEGILTQIIIVDTFEYDKKRLDCFELLGKMPIKYIELDTPRPVCEFLNKFRLQISQNANIELYSKYRYNDYYASYKPFFQSKILENLGKKDIKYIRYPLVIRERAETAFHY